MPQQRVDQIRSIREKIIGELQTKHIGPGSKLEVFLCENVASSSDIIAQSSQFSRARGDESRIGYVAQVNNYSVLLSEGWDIVKKKPRGHQTQIYYEAIYTFNSCSC